MSDFFDKVTAERLYQEQKWGATDDLNTEYNWAAYINAYASRNLIGTPGSNLERVMAFKQDMIKVAALAQAAYEKL